MTKEQAQFLESINAGKWFKVNGKYGGTYAVKMIKSKSYNEGVHSLWLSFNDPESMAIEDYLKGDWKYEDNKFDQQGAGVYHFGSFEVEDDSIYDTKGHVIIEKMVEEIMRSTEAGFMTSDEILDIWSKLTNDEFDSEILECK